jgi:hypothetical protein
VIGEDRFAGISAHKVPPKNLGGFPTAVRVRPRTARQGGGLRARWKDDWDHIYEWDYDHGRVERYDPRGEHLGEYDPDTGSQTKPPKPGRRVKP